jgi:hypothetical protein
MKNRLVVAAFCVAVAATSRVEGQVEPLAYSVDPDRSSLYLVTHRAGLLSFLGHEHAIVPAAWTAELCLADPVTRFARGSVLIQTSSLVIDTDSARALAGLGDGPGAEDLLELQTKMLDSDHLDADAFPEILVTVDSVAPGGDSGVRGFGRLSLHGVVREVAIPVEVTFHDDGTSELRGTVRIRQRDFGIEPESSAGLVKVSNDVDLHFLLVSEPTRQPCGSVGQQGR